MAPLTKLEAAVANAYTASEALIRSSSSLPVRISALLAYRYARQAYDRAVAGTPTTIAYSVQSRTSLSRLVATVYGGGSRSLDAQILALNRIATPHAIAQGAVLRLPSPDLIRQQLRSVT
jgi:nucleoid-associated protein YgaU